MENISQYKIKDPLDKRETKELPRFGGRLKNCPQSLKQIVKTFRYVAFSFSGLDFEDAWKENGQNKKQGNFNDSSSMSFKSKLLLGINLFITSTYVIPFIYSQKQKATKAVNANSTEETFNIEEVFGLAQYQNEFSNLKPILRTVMELVVYVFVFEGFINFLYNFFTGGKMICRLAKIPNIEKLDTSNFAVRKITAIMVMIAAIYIAGLVMFNQVHLKVLYRLVFDEKFVLEPNMKMQLIKLGTFSILHCTHYVILTMIPLLFYYIMTIFSKAVDGISESSQTVELNEANLCKIKDKIVTLNEHYKMCMREFSMPMTLVIVNSVIMIIGSCCFLMLKGGNQYYGSLIFEFGIYAFIRLVLVCSVGNQVTNAYRELIRVIFENVRVWGMDEWMCFIEIKRMRSQFKVTFLGTYSLKQSTILAVLGFALNYIVVLLQTENYGSSAADSLAQNASVIEQH